MSKYYDDGDDCPWCDTHVKNPADRGTLELLTGSYPYKESYLQCTNCDSTFLLFEEKPKFKNPRKNVIMDFIEDAIDVITDIWD